MRGGVSSDASGPAQAIARGDPGGIPGRQYEGTAPAAGWRVCAGAAAWEAFQRAGLPDARGRRRRRDATRGGETLDDGLVNGQVDGCGLDGGASGGGYRDGVRTG